MCFHVGPVVAGARRPGHRLERDAPATGKLDDLVGDVFGEEEVVEEVVEFFLQEVPLQMDELRKALEECDFHQVQELAHGMKGSCLNVAAGTMGEVAREIEFLCRENELDKVPEATKKLADAFDTTKKVITGQNSPDE